VEQHHPEEEKADEKEDAQATGARPLRDDAKEKRALNTSKARAGANKCEEFSALYSWCLADFLSQLA